MKTTTQTTSTAKAALSKGLRSASRKPKAKVTSRAANKSADAIHSTLSGYSDSAQRFLKHGKSTFGEAYSWAGKTGKSLPDGVRNLGLPDQKSVQTFMSDRPLILGAVGLGIGVVLGAMLPSMGTTQKSMAKSVRHK